jgi:hypothetical protein
LIFSFLWANAALASTELTGSAGVKLAYHDNLFLEKDNTDDDLLTHLKAQLGIVAERPRIELNADYQLNFIFYNEHDELDETDLKDVSRLTSSLKLGSWAGFSLLIEDNIDRVSVDESSKVNEDSDAINKTNRNTFRATPSYEKNLAPTLRLQASYRFEDVSHTNTAADQRRTQAVSSTLTKTLSRRTSLYILGLYQEVDAENTLDYDRYEGLFGGRYALTKAALFAAEAGIAKSEHEDENDKETTAIWDVSLTAPAGKKTTATLGAIQTLRHSELDGLYKSRVWDFSLVREGRVGVKVNLYQANDDYLIIDREDKNTGAGIEVQLKLSPLLTAQSTLRYIKTKLEPLGERKKTYRATASLSYEHQHFVVSGSYSFQEEDSDITLNSYVSNVFFVELTARM